MTGRRYLVRWQAYGAPLAPQAPPVETWWLPAGATQADAIECVRQMRRRYGRHLVSVRFEHSLPEEEAPLRPVRELRANARTTPNKAHRRTSSSRRLSGLSLRALAPRSSRRSARHLAA